MLHLLLFHLFLQVITLPTQITDLASWLLIPAVMGVIAPALTNGIVSLWPDKLKPLTTGIKFLVYIAIAVTSVALANVNPAQLAAWNPLFIAVMAAIAAFIGDKTSTATVGALMIIANGIRTAGQVIGLLGLRLAIGRDGAKSFHSEAHAHG